MSDATTQEIKNKLDIIDFLKGYIELLPAGKNYKARCPFHREKTPSFMVSPDRQTWHCFGTCATGGDIFTFLMCYENLEFFEALKVLAEKAGVELKRADPAEQRQFGVLYDINLLAKNFFMDELRLSESATNYLKTRSLKSETLHEFEIGFVANKPDALTLHLIHKGVSVQDIERSGMAFKTDRGGYMDRFRGRVMFPINNHFGKTVGFTGRVLPEFDTGLTGKYVNSPETAIFKKSKLLYGFYKTKQAIRESKSVLLVEGQMDFLMSYQDGVKNVVATSGTALTGDHLTVLSKYAETAILCFDTDEAGLEAAERAIDLTAQFDFETKVLMLPDKAKDPAEIVEDEPGKLAKLIAEARPAMEFYFEKYLKHGHDKKNIRAVLLKIKSLPSALDRNLALKALGERTGFSEKDLAEEMEQLKPTVSAGIKKETTNAAVISAVPDSLPDLSRYGMIAGNIIALAISKNDLALLQSHRDHFPAWHRRVIDFLLDPTVPVDTAMSAFVNSLTLRVGMDMMHDEQALLAELRREYLKDKQDELQSRIIRSEKTGDEADMAKLMQEVDLLSRELHS